MFKIQFNKFIYLIFTFFLASRLFILHNPPPHFSDVKQDYERYANIWWYGLEPYKEVIYEYPPATVPLLVLPLLVDQLGFGNYYQNYRIQIFLFDIVLFILILKLHSYLKTENKSKYLSLFFIIISGLISKNFLYEGIDLIFSGLIAICLISYKIYSQAKIRNRIVFWALFWWSFAIKFMSFPLFPILYISRKMKIKKELLSMLVGFLLIWAFPLIYYRSSLSVSYVFHQNRTLKYSSFGDYIIRMINIFSNTETRSSEPPDFSMLGPISNFLNHYLKLAFLASMLIIVLHSLLIVIPNLKLKTLFKKISSLFLKTGQLKITVDLYPYLLRSTILFFLILFIFGITISQPFAIWLIPILSIFPYKNYKQQTAILTLSTVYIMQMTSPIYSHIIPFANEQIFIYPVNWGIIKDTLRFLSLILLIILSLNLSYEKNPQN